MNRKYGDCVERIVLRSKAQKGTPLFGKVVFKISTVPVLILNGKDEVKFLVNERSLWCKKYQPRKSRHANGGQHWCSPAYFCRREVTTWSMMKLWFDNGIDFGFLINNNANPFSYGLVSSWFGGFLIVGFLSLSLFSFFFPF